MNQMREAYNKLAASYLINFSDFEAGWDACAEWQAAQSVSVPVVGEVVAYLKADSTGKILWSEDCVCEDAVWAGEDSEFGEYSLPLIIQPTTSTTAAELDALRKDAERYQWLRDKSHSLETRQYDKGIRNGPSCYHEVEGIRELKYDAALDAAIDAAIAGEKNHG